jgi:hypothetical protein
MAGKGSVRHWNPGALILLTLLLVLPSCLDDVTGPNYDSADEAGGTVTLANGAVHLLISAGSLSGEVSFSATEPAEFLQSDLLVPGSTFRIGPPGTSFAKLFTVTISYDPNSLPETVREKELRLVQEIAVQADSVKWVELQGQSLDTLSHEVSGRTDRLGVFGVKGVDVAYVKVSPGFYVMEKGESRGWSAVARDANGTYLPGRPISWSSADPLVVTVDAGGEVTAVNQGKTLITAEAEGKASMAEVNVISCEDQTQIPASECSALLEIFGQVWRSSGVWTPTPEPCGWYGVTCTGGRVTELDLRRLYLPGTLSNAIMDLPELTYLDLSSNEFSGPIPPFLGNLSKLTYLNLTANSFTGPLPDQLQNLKELRVLDVLRNNLSGPVPGWLGSLSHLTNLTLGYNAFSGPLPSELGGLSELNLLYLSYNQLSGNIPPELGQLTSLQSLRLSGNQFAGSIPAELGNLTNLTDLTLSDNQLGGAIPSELGSLSNLDLFYLSGNHLSGQIPLAVAQLGGQIQARPGGRLSCVFTPPGNENLTMPDTQEYRDADLVGTGVICGVAMGGS